MIKTALRNALNPRLLTRPHVFPIHQRLPLIAVWREFHAKAVGTAVGKFPDDPALALGLAAGHGEGVVSKAPRLDIRSQPHRIPPTHRIAFLAAVERQDPVAFETDGALTLLTASLQ